MNRRAWGQEAERIACAYLERQGLALVQANYHCRYGEIDLIMREGDDLVFVEVRMRSDAAYGGALESVGPGKRRKLTRTALHYLQRNGPNVNARFDVVAIEAASTINWIRNAFDAHPY